MGELASGTQKEHAQIHATSVPITKAVPAAAKKKLSYLDSREFSTMEGRITEAERVLAAARARLEDRTLAATRNASRTVIARGAVCA
ncbi:MAG: hypothetical protein ACR2JB_18725 [Bryobacteraceae bacterium]